VNWTAVLNEAQNKEAGLEFVFISEILTSMPESEFETVNWIKKPSWQEFRADIDKIVHEMISGEAA